MPTLRNIVDGVMSIQAATSSIKAAVEEQPMFKVKDQVVVRRQCNRSGPVTNEIKVGTILAFAADGKTATLSMSGPGGRLHRAVVSIDQLTPVTAAFRRASVQVNPIHRQIHMA